MQPMWNTGGSSWMNLWPKHWPRGLIVFISVIQSLLTFLILSVQTVLVAIIVLTITEYERFYTISYVAWLFFLGSAIGSCSTSCCNNTGFAGATFAGAMNLIAFIFSAVLINESNRIIKADGIFAGIFFSCTLGNLSGWNNYYPYDTDFLEIFCDTASALAKSLLALSVLMLVSSFIYIAAYVYTLIRVLAMNKQVTGYPSAPVVAPGQRFPMTTPSYPHPALPPIHMPAHLPGPIPYPIQPEQSNLQRVQYNPGQTNADEANVKF